MKEFVDQQIRNLVGTKIFTVKFIKRTNGEERIMNCSLNYKGRTVGGELKYSPREKKLLIVLDHQKNSIRSIALDSIVWVKANTKVYKIKDEELIEADPKIVGA